MTGMARASEQPSYTPFFVALLVVAAFIIGSLITKVQYLEKGATTQTAPQTKPDTTAAKEPAGKIKEVSNQDHIRGNKNAKVTLVEYSDFECPFCKQFHPTMLEILKTYGDKVRWVYRHFPLSFHQNAQKEAEASECVAELSGNDKFWEFTDTIFDRTKSNGLGFALQDLAPLAAEIGVDQAKFQTCLDDGKYAQLVKDQMADGGAAGVSGTPATFIIDASGKSKIIIGAQPLESFKAAIDEALK